MGFAAFLEILIIFELPRKTHLPTQKPAGGPIFKKTRVFSQP
jgi:formylmethanofuran dehydrogenase subunit A